MVSKGFLRVFEVLLVMVLGLMALGAGVRAMNAGLSCPDWPLCFGKVIPDFHVGVYFEFIHRAYAGLVALFFSFCMIHLLKKKEIPARIKTLVWIAAGLLATQIIMGGLTVLQLLKSWTVATHLMFATLFFASLLWVRFELSPEVAPRPLPMPRWLTRVATLLPFVVLGQILLGGMIASTYSGLVCVDFPLCNGQWVPTLRGPIGLQVLHRFGAYGVTAFVLGIFLSLRLGGSSLQASLNEQLFGLSRWLLSVTLVQVCLGIANVIFFLPAWLTVLHQVFGITLLALSLRFAFVVHWQAAVAVMAKEDQKTRLRVVTAGAAGVK